MHSYTLDADEAFQHVPKYFRIQQDLLDHIRSKRWAPGATIPSEAELCAQYQVSRGTIRRALDELDRQGLISRSPGKQTVVNAPKISLLASGFRTDIAKKGMRPGSRVLAIEHTKAPLEVADLLGIPHGTPVLLIQRIITADDVPIIIESVHLARPAIVVTPGEVESTSLLELLPTKCGVFLTRAVESYEPTRLTREHAALLHAKAGDLGIKDQAVLYDADGQPLYVSTAVVRGDKARIVTETSLSVHS